MALLRGDLPAHRGTDRCWRCAEGLHGLDAKRGSCSCLCHLPKGDTTLGRAGRPHAVPKPRNSAPPGAMRPIRQRVFERDRYRCRYCGKALVEDHPTVARRPTVDHLLPKSRGGPNTMENLVTACRRDNNRKADRTPEEAGMILLPIPDHHQPEGAA